MSSVPVRGFVRTLEGVLSPLQRQESPRGASSQEESWGPSRKCLGYREPLWDPEG